MNKFNQYVIMGLGSSPIHFGLEGIRLMVRIFLKRSNNYKYANVLFIKKNIFNIFFVVFEMALGVAEPPHGQTMALRVVQPPPRAMGVASPWGWISHSQRPNQIF
jgi:hypothetical protein